MMGLATMAWRLAQSRTRPSILPAPSPRWATHDSVDTPSAEYYRIIYRAALMLGNRHPGSGWRIYL